MFQRLGDILKETFFCFKKDYMMKIIMLVFLSWYEFLEIVDLKNIYEWK